MTLCVCLSEVRAPDVCLLSESDYGMYGWRQEALDAQSIL